MANRGTEPVELEVYAADGYTTSTGALDLKVAGEQSVGVGAWITVPQTHVSVAAGQTVEVPFSVDVPANATPGDYAGGVVTSLTVADTSANVNVDRRLGIRTGIRVGGDLAPALAIDDLAVRWDGGVIPFLFGDATVHYRLHNTGNVSLSADETDAVTGPSVRPAPRLRPRRPRRRCCPATRGSATCACPPSPRWACCSPRSRPRPW